MALILFARHLRSPTDEGIEFSLLALMIVGITAVAFRLTLARKVPLQYPWLYERRGLFGWREKRAGCHTRHASVRPAQASIVSPRQPGASRAAEWGAAAARWFSRRVFSLTERGMQAMRKLSTFVIPAAAVAALTLGHAEAQDIVVATAGPMTGGEAVFG